MGAGNLEYIKRMAKSRKNIAVVIVICLFLAFSFSVEIIQCPYCGGEAELYGQCVACGFDGKMTIARAIFLALIQRRGRI
jgi:hypothetical protein